MAYVVPRPLQQLVDGKPKKPCLSYKIKDMTAADPKSDKTVVGGRPCKPESS